MGNKPCSCISSSSPKIPRSHGHGHGLKRDYKNTGEARNGPGTEPSEPPPNSHLPHISDREQIDGNLLDFNTWKPFEFNKPMNLFWIQYSGASYFIRSTRPFKILIVQNTNQIFPLETFFCFFCIQYMYIPDICCKGVRCNEGWLHVLCVVNSLGLAELNLNRENVSPRKFACCPLWFSLILVRLVFFSCEPLHYVLTYKITIICLLNYTNLQPLFIISIQYSKVNCDDWLRSKSH